MIMIEHNQESSLANTEPPLSLDKQNENVINEEIEAEEELIFEDDINKYFSKSHLLTKNIISEKRTLVKFLGEKWNDLDENRKDALLDLLFVEDNVRQQQIFPLKSEESVIQDSFPRLYINGGQKINVDFENDLWTWRDEHSGPFSWMSRSQQDLTLLDLEPENISKPQPKTLRLDPENPDNLRNAEDQFVHPANCWSRDIIDNYWKAEREITLTPSPSLDLTTVCNESERNVVQEINQGFEDQENEHHHCHQSEIVTAQPLGLGDKKEEEVQTQTQSDDSAVKRKGSSSSKDKKKRSPSPKKIHRSSISRKSPSKSLDQGEQQLIGENHDDSYEERNTFSNPLVETEWSSFVGENGKTTDEKNKKDIEIPMKTMVTVPVLPTAQVMDRGSEVVTGSPYQVQNDDVSLITPIKESDVSAHNGRMYSMTNQLSGWSAESTPDHNTHLLKGMQNESKKPPEQQVQYQYTPAVLDKYEPDEVLTVESQGNEIKITSQKEHDSKRDSDIPTTGYDFLDNW